MRRRLEFDETMAAEIQKQQNYSWDKEEWYPFSP
jgi:hypothetical protein